MTLKQFVNVKKEFLNKIEKYNEANNEYSTSGHDYCHDMEMNHSELLILLKKYTNLLSSMSRDSLLIEYREALKYLDQANGEYGKFIITTPLVPGENPPVTPFNELHAASDKLEFAEEWLNAIRKLIYK